MEKTVAKFLTTVGAPVAEAHCERLIRTHADYPALISIADAFERLGLQHSISMVDRAELTTLPYPYLVHTEASGGDIIAIGKAADITANEEALTHWSGVVIQVDPTPVLEVQERARAYKRQQFARLLTLILGLIGALTTGYVAYKLVGATTPAVALSLGGLLLTAAAGVGIGYLLLAKEVGIKYNSVEAFCAVEGQHKTDCNRILNSDGASLLGVVKLSEAVFAYFAFQLAAVYLAVLGGAAYTTLLTVLGALSLLSLPVVVYSVVYQYAIAKTWCKLCLLVDAVLVGQLGTVLALYQAGAFLPGAAAPVAAAGYGLLLVALLALTVLGKAWAKDYTDVVKSEAEALRVKSSVTLFKYLLRFTRRITITPFEDEIILGNPAARLKLVLVLNLHCQPCKEHFQKVVDAVTLYPQDLQIALRFVLSGRDAHVYPTTVHYLIRYWREHILGQPEESRRTIALLQEWFEVMDLERFKQKHPVDFSVPDSQSEQLSQAHRQWVLREQITRTPALFIDGYYLPQNYTLDDILAMTQELMHAMSPEGTLVG